jgi:hypothetical protein
MSPRQTREPAVEESFIVAGEEVSLSLIVRTFPMVCAGLPAQSRSVSLQMSLPQRDGSRSEFLRRRTVGRDKDGPAGALEITQMG